MLFTRVNTSLKDCSHELVLTPLTKPVHTTLYALGFSIGVTVSARFARADNKRLANCVVLNKRLVVLNTTSDGTVSYEPVDPLLWAACMWGMERDPRASVDRLEARWEGLVLVLWTS